MKSAVILLDKESQDKFTEQVQSCSKCSIFSDNHLNVCSTTHLSIRGKIFNISAISINFQGEVIFHVFFSNKRKSTS
jgi:hypothetical protein